MGWPNDARYKTAAPGLPVPSATANEVQDRIVDIYRDKTKVFWPTNFENQTGADYMSWTPVGGGGSLPEMGCLEASRKLWVPLPLRAGSIIKQIQTKVYLTTAGLAINIIKQDIQIGNPTSPPVRTLLLSPSTPSGTPPYWTTITVSGLSYSVGQNEIYMVEVNSAAAGDRCSGTLVTFEPLTPTP